METPSHQSLGDRTSLRVILSLTLLISGIISSSCFAGLPAWWFYRDVLNGKAPEDYGIFNQGQLKQVVAACVDEMNAKLEGGGGIALNAIITGWRSPAASPDDFAVVNLGQLKAIAKPIYDRLNEVYGTTGYYPWSGIGPDDYAAANIGQLKKLMAIDVMLPPNVSQNGGPAGIYDSEADPDQDGLPTWFEILVGTDPFDRDSDEDGISDGEEDHDADSINNLAEYLSRTNHSGNYTDADGDGLSDDEEVALGTSANAIDSDEDGASDAFEQASGSDPLDINSTPWIRLKVTTPIR